MRAAAVTYWGAAVREGRHADGGAHLIGGGGGEGGWGGAPFLCFLSVEEVTPGPLDAADMVHETQALMNASETLRSASPRLRRLIGSSCAAATQLIFKN